MWNELPTAVLWKSCDPVGIAAGTGHGTCDDGAPARKRITTSPGWMPALGSKGAYASEGAAPDGMRAKLARLSCWPAYSTLMCAGVFQVLATNAAKHASWSVS